MAALAIVALVFLIGVLRGEDLRLMLMTSIGMAVAAVPEGLARGGDHCPGFGASRMLKRQALIRKLPAVEALGSVTTICSDKTGTLTENRMTVTVVDMAENHIDLTEDEIRLPLSGLSSLSGAPDPEQAQALKQCLPLRLDVGRRCIVQRCLAGKRRGESRLSSRWRSHRRGAGAGCGAHGAG